MVLLMLDQCTVYKREGESGERERVERERGSGEREGEGGEKERGADSQDRHLGDVSTLTFSGHKGWHTRTTHQVCVCV